MLYSKYKYITTVARLQSISKAAKELYISQPALTKYINKMEDDLGVKLFTRNVIPISLTSAGRKFVEEAERIVEIEKKLYQKIEGFSNMRQNRLTIGITGNRGARWLPMFLPVFHKKYPKVELKIVEENFNRLEEQVVKGDIDVCLTVLPLSSEEIEYEVLCEENILMIVPENHELLEGADLSDNSLDNLIYVDPEKLHGYDYLELSSSPGIDRKMPRVFERYGIVQNIVLESQDINTLFKLATMGMGITLATDVIVRRHFPAWLPAFCYFETPLPKRTCVAAFRRNGHTSDMVYAFIEIAKNILTTCPEYRSIAHEEFIVVRHMEKKGNSTKHSTKQWFDNITE